MRTTVSRWLSVCLPAIFVLGWAHPAHAQIFESVGIRAQGMGGAFVAVADDATASWWNPAGLANGAFFNSLLEWDEGTDPARERARAFAIAYPALGLSYYRLALHDVRPGLPPGAVPDRADDGQALSLFGATVGQSIGNRLVLASTAKIVHTRGETRGDLDVGAMAAFGSLRLGLTVKNVVRPTFSDDGGPFELPRQARVGAAFSVGASGHPDAILAIDADLTRTPTPVGDARHLAAGVEVWEAKRRVGLRAGVGVDTTGESRHSASLGTSLALRAGLYGEFQVTRGQDDIRNGWGFGLRVTF